MTLASDDADARPVVGVQVLVMDVGAEAVLLGRRANTFGDGTWALPGGHLEFGESFEDAAARELREETGLKASELRTFMPLNTPYETTHYVQIGVEVLRYHGAVANLEPHRCSELRFFPLDQLPSPLFAPSVPFLDHAKSRLAQPDDTVQMTMHLRSVTPEGNRRRYVSLYLIGGVPCHVVLFLGRIGEGRPRQQRRYVFEELTPALEFARVELGRRFKHGYTLADCSGSISITQLRGLLPEGRSLRLTTSDEELPQQPTLPFDQQALPLDAEFDRDGRYGGE